MIVCVDADYRETEGFTAGVGIDEFADKDPCCERVIRTGPPAPYEPGHFYRRELPGILSLLESLAAKIVVIDGYVWLGKDRPGLGAHLHTAIGLPVIGVAKMPFRDNDEAREVLRGGSKRALYVTSVGVSLDEACAAITGMHGAHRLPTILKRVDRLCRSAN